MKPLTIVGLVLLILGIAALAYPQIRYRDREQVLKIGPLQATAETERSVPIPPILGWGLVVAGAGAIATGAMQKGSV